MKEKMNEELNKILKKMCSIVGTNFNKMNFEQEHWFWKHQWTSKEENKFRDWMVKHLNTSAEARQYLMKYPRKDKKNIEKVVNEFIFNYGWKTKEK